MSPGRARNAFDLNIFRTFRTLQQGHSADISLLPLTSDETMPAAKKTKTEGVCLFMTALAFLSALAEIGILALAFMACGFAAIAFEEASERRPAVK